MTLLLILFVLKRIKIFGIHEFYIKKNNVGERDFNYIKISNYFNFKKIL